MCGTRRGEIKRSLSESWVDTCLTFSWHLGKHVFLLNDMFSIELELISVVSKPTGGNQALSIRIRGRYIFNVFLASRETRVSAKMICFQSNWRPPPLCGARREEIERSLSESGVDTFLLFS